MSCKCTHDFDEHDETWKCNLCECCMYEDDEDDDDLSPGDGYEDQGD